MSYQANQPGTELTPEEQLILSELADLGTPGQVLVVDELGTGIEYITLSLSGYVPYTGATGNVNLGVYEIIAGSADINGDAEVGTRTIVITGTLSPNVVGDYTYGGTYNGYPYWQLNTTEYLWWRNDGYWIISPALGDSSSPFWYYGSVSFVPPVGVTWLNYNGSTGSPTVADKENLTVKGKFVTEGIEATIGSNLNISGIATAEELNLRAYGNTLSQGVRVYSNFSQGHIVAGVDNYGLKIRADYSLGVIKFQTAGENDRVIIDQTGKMGIGTTSPSAFLHTIATTEQQRIGYDVSNYFSTTVGSTGAVVFDAVGSGANFNFSDSVNVVGGIKASGDASPLTSNPSGNASFLGYQSFASGWTGNGFNFSFPTANPFSLVVGADGTGNFGNPTTGTIYLNVADGNSYFTKSLGIGEVNPSSPQRLLHINTAANVEGIRVQANSPTHEFYTTAGLTNNRNWSFNTNFNAAGVFELRYSTTNTAAPSATLFTGTPSGQFGIGTSPNAILHIKGAFGSNGQFIMQPASGTGTGTQLLWEWQDSAGTRQAYQYLASGNFQIKNEQSGGNISLIPNNTSYGFYLTTGASEGYITNSVIMTNDNSGGHVSMGSSGGSGSVIIKPGTAGVSSGTGLGLFWNNLNVFGTNDYFFQGIPGNASTGKMVYEGYASSGTVFSNFATAGGGEMVWAPQRTERMRMTPTNGYLNLGVASNTETAKLYILNTTEQLRLAYDASNYYSTTVGSTGGVTFDAVGSGAGFTFSDDIILADAKNIQFNATTGTKIGTATGQKLAFWNTTPIVQPTTAIAESTFTENAGGVAVNDDSTFDGYTLGQVVKALRNVGLLQ